MVYQWTVKLSNRTNDFLPMVPFVDDWYVFVHMGNVCHTPNANMPDHSVVAWDES